MKTARGFEGTLTVPVVVVSAALVAGAREGEDVGSRAAAKMKAARP
jgi:hypothetical protein